MTEWRPISEAPLWTDGIYIWHDDELVHVCWTKARRHDQCAWCTVEVDRYGDEAFRVEPQPKFYLNVTPPPES